MTTKEKDPFLPFITLSQMLAFDPDVPESYTKSDFVNHFLRVFLRMRSPRIEPIADIMELDRRLLAAVFKVETGLSFQEWRDRWEIFEWSLYIYAYGQKYDKEEVAHHLGYADSSSLWRFAHSARYKKYVKEHNIMAKTDPDYIRALKAKKEKYRPLREAYEAEVLRNLKEQMDKAHITAPFEIVLSKK